MRFTNNTPLPVAMVPSADEGGNMVALCLCSLTCRIVSPSLSLAPAQKGLLLAQESPFPNDAMFMKAGTSVCATGFVYPRGRDERRAAARLTVGDRHNVISVFGPRVWEKCARTGTIAVSLPGPFEKVAMVWENAYGGIVQEAASVVQVDGEAAFVPPHASGYSSNIGGIGYYTNEAHAIDSPLPRLENPEQPIQRWHDRPEPVCFAPYPLWGGLRANFVVQDRTFDPGSIGKLSSRAAPRGTFDQIMPQTPIVLVGMCPDGSELSFAVPRSPCFVALHIGGASKNLALVPDAIDIDADMKEVRIVYRTTIRYPLIAFQARSASIELAKSFGQDFYVA